MGVVPLEGWSQSHAPFPLQGGIWDLCCSANRRLGSGPGFPMEYHQSTRQMQWRFPSNVFTLCCQPSKNTNVWDNVWDNPPVVIQLAKFLWSTDWGEEIRIKHAGLLVSGVILRIVSFDRTTSRFAGRQTSINQVKRVWPKRPSLTWSLWLFSHTPPPASTPSTGKIQQLLNKMKFSWMEDVSAPPSGRQGNYSVLCSEMSHLRFFMEHGGPESGTC